MVAPLPLQQLAPASGSVVTFVGTFLALSVMYAVTAHIAARWVLGTVPFTRALLVGPVPAAVSLLLQSYGPAVAIGVTLLADAIAIQAVYRLSTRMTALVSVAHYTVSVILGVTLYNLLALLSTAPS